MSQRPFHCSGKRKVALGVERPTDTWLVQRQPTPSWDSRPGCNRSFCTSDFPAVITNAGNCHSQTSLPSTNLKNRSRHSPLLSNKSPPLSPPKRQLVHCLPPLLCRSNQLNHIMRFHFPMVTICKTTMRLLWQMEPRIFTTARAHRAATSVEERIHEWPAGYGHRRQRLTPCVLHWAPRRQWSELQSTGGGRRC
ncbi:hypothetical protein EDB83DRAFT_1224860 [Lactarius deliciosus]|nr:hypothetical protein EDB83DRAFT_1224860 [Lactarius deliciosus]